MVSPAASQQENTWFRLLLVLSLWSLHALLVPEWVISRFSIQSQAWLIRDSRLAMEKRFFREVLNKEPYECIIKYI